tara:strand:+ start:1654 stop:2664 length:1011 start_codon:yes stop_codon:yes gene_type:complete
MRNFLYLSAFVAVFFLTPVSSKASASCGQANATNVVDDLTTSSTNIQTCVTDAAGLKYTFKAMGVCKGFPDYADGLSNCFTLFDRSITVDLTSSGADAENLTAILPPADAAGYDYYFAVTDNSFTLEGLLEFGSNQYMGIDANNDPITADWCRPSGSFNTSLTASVPASTLSVQTASAFQAILPSLPLECGTGSGVAGTATVNIDSLGFTSFSSVLNIDGFDWESSIDEASPVNVVLLNANGRRAANSGTVQDVLFVKKPFNNLVVTDSHTSVDVEFTTHEAAQVFYLCNSVLQNQTVVTALGLGAAPTDGCAVLGAALGRGGLSPNLTMLPVPPN